MLNCPAETWDGFHRAFFATLLAGSHWALRKIPCACCFFQTPGMLCWCHLCCLAIEKTKTSGNMVTVEHSSASTHVKCAACLWMAVLVKSDVAFLKPIYLMVPSIQDRVRVSLCLWLCVFPGQHCGGMAIMDFHSCICSVMLPASGRSDSVWKSAAHLKKSLSVTRKLYLPNCWPGLLIMTVN